jgi:iron-sulfur cluster repair protein YtfE (RIC family)
MSPATQLPSPSDHESPVGCVDDRRTEQRGGASRNEQVAASCQAGQEHRDPNQPHDEDDAGEAWLDQTMNRHRGRQTMTAIHRSIPRVQGHGARLPETLLPLKATFERLKAEMLQHMLKEESVLFPALVALEASAPAEGSADAWVWIDQPIQVMETEHEEAGAALARLREITRGYAPPEDACPTFRGL